MSVTDIWENYRNKSVLKDFVFLSPEDIDLRPGVCMFIAGELEYILTSSAKYSDYLFNVVSDTVWYSKQEYIDTYRLTKTEYKDILQWEALSFIINKEI